MNPLKSLSGLAGIRRARFVSQQLLLAVSLALAVADADAGTISYTHDPAGRLTGVGYASGKRQSFTYDNAGNLLQNQTAVPGIGNDTDGDGLDDAWEQTLFGTLDRDGTGDFDHDGFSDLQEFLAGTDPTSAGSLLRLALPQLAGEGTTIQWQAISGKTYRLQYKDNLSAAGWNNISGDITAGGSVASKVDPTPPTHGRRYYRVLLVP